MPNNSEFYEILQCLTETDRPTEKPGEMAERSMLHHGNVPCRALLPIRHFLAGKNIPLLPQPA